MVSDSRYAAHSGGVNDERIGSGSSQSGGGAAPVCAAALDHG